MVDGPRYRLTLAAQRSDVPAIQRLRALLKSLGRTYGFRCNLAEELPAKPSPCTQDATNPEAVPPSDREGKSAGVSKSWRCWRESVVPCWMNNKKGKHYEQ
jgi:hypothetical protein